MPVKEREKMMNMIREYILKRQNLACLFLLIDTRLEMQKADRQFLQFLGSNQVPFALVFTKTDKITPAQVRQNIDQYKKTLLESWESLPPVFLTSAFHKKGREELLEFIKETLR
jgi:GTP-binding protein